jgi:hypothetical protein
MEGIQLNIRLRFLGKKIMKFISLQTMLHDIKKMENE